MIDAPDANRSIAARTQFVTVPKFSAINAASPFGDTSANIA